MTPPQLEVELLSARDTFNEALERSAPDLRDVAGRYGALLDEYLDKLRELSAVRAEPSGGMRSLGAAAQLDYRDSIEWARSERERVTQVLGTPEGAGRQAKKKKGSRK